MDGITDIDERFIYRPITLTFKGKQDNMVHSIICYTLKAYCLGYQTLEELEVYGVYYLILFFI